MPISSCPLPVAISHVLYDRTTGVESWITSDGRAYVVYLTQSPEEPSSSNSSSNDPLQFQAPQIPDGQQRNVWMGTCIHNFETPRWVQKQRRVEPHEQNESLYFEPMRAVRIAVNAKFSMIAVGMLGYLDLFFFDMHTRFTHIILLRGGIQYSSFPTEEGILPAFQKVEIPSLFNRQTGRVCSMEWSSDGYVLAVGWQHGWGIFSVGGRCLVSGFGVEDVDEKKFVDMPFLLCVF